ncbi:PPA1309 family protein [Aquipuribacter hungaricus]|uniref:PPA1309 family protein n=1 Tax=Aquipuribacter hungaricus TaxID=545624 RepID=A0ABV7WPG7_9MICO
MTTEQSLQRAVREVEEHVAAYGWDSPVRLFALVRTAEALQREPDLASQLPPEDAEAAAADPDHLLLVEQDELDELSAQPGGAAEGDGPAAGAAEATDALERMLGRLAWPPEVEGVALTVERLVVPPEVEALAPADPEEAVRWLGEHPRRREVRIAAGVLRDGSRACVLRIRGTALEPDEDVVTGPDLVPGLTRALASTLED